MIRVVVVDDQPLARAGIAMLVNAEKDIAVVAEAADGQDALTQAHAQRPEVILMDVRMPGTDGVEATRAVINEGLTTQSGQPIRVIILTTFHLDEYVYAALRVGASGFLLKDAAPTEIVAAIRAVAGGEAWLGPAVTRRLIDDFATRLEPPLVLQTSSPDLCLPTGPGHPTSSATSAQQRANRLPPKATIRPTTSGRPSRGGPFDRLLQFFEWVLSSEAKTMRAERLLRLVLRAVVGTVVGLAVIVALLVTSVPWWTVASVLGVTVVGRGGAALARRWRR